jgi:hypothetical protein
VCSRKEALYAIIARQHPGESTRQETPAGIVYYGVRHYTALRYTHEVDHAPEITVLQMPKFKAEATDLIGADGIDGVAAYLAEHPNAGDVIPGVGGARKLRWAKGKGKRGGARIIYLYVVIAERIFLLRCYAKNVKADLTANDKKELRNIAAYLKGAQ